MRVIRDARLLAASLCLSLLAVGAQVASAPTASGTSERSALAPVSAAVARDLAALPDSAPYGVYVTTRGGDAATREALLTDHGLTPVKDFGSVDTVYGAGTLAAVATLRSSPMVSYVSTSRTLRALDDSSGWAMRVEQVQRAVGNGPYRDAAGRLIDGTGVGVAVVDSGVDGTHPDLASRVVRNVKWKCSTPVLQNTTTKMCFGPVVSVPLPDTDLSGGHGTHVAGIVAGDGTASKGTYRGTAPKASIYGYAVGDGDSIFDFDVAAAFQDILDTNAAGTNTPRIRVATNSWGDSAGTAYDPNDILSLLTKKLVQNGVTVLFAAGNGDATNNGGTGADDRLSSTAKDPTPGVITVANYDDAGTGTRNGNLSSSSSRGKKGVATQYPDISAPGTLITSTCRAYKPICDLGPEPTWAPAYATISGTSMATPAVAGIVALLLQARPELTPAQVEDILQDTAYKFGTASSYEPDPQNLGGTTSFDKGAGLVDAQAALDALSVAHDGGERSQGVPSVTVDAPTDGTVNDGTAPLQVSGSAGDGYVAPAPFTPQVIASGDGGDAPAAGDSDVVSVSALETTTGMRYTLTFRNLNDLGPYYQRLYLYQTVNGTKYATQITQDATSTKAAAADPTYNNAIATEITVNKAGNTVSFTLPFGALGNPGPMTPAYKVYLESDEGPVADFAPGGVGTSLIVTSPEYASYVMRRPSVTGPPVTTVTLALDRGTPQPVALTGASPSYTWSTTIDTTALAEGPHTLTATVLTNGVAGPSRTVGFTVTRPVVVVSSAAITSPAEGETVPLGVVTVTGTTETNAPAAQVRSVTVQVTGAGYDSGELRADGTTAWSVPFDTAALSAGAYVITARLYLDGVVAATATRSVVVPAPPVVVSCSPRGVSFWQDQFNGSRKAAFTAAEADTIADKAASMSAGYLTKSALVTVLYAKGKLPAETATARQYAALLLNLAAGQLSPGMSVKLGLSGREGLSTSSYDTQLVGTTVGAAAQWIRAQLPSGQLAKAEQTAININTRTGLAC